MSLFDQSKQTTVTPTNQDTTVSDDPIEALVGEGKKFKDIQSLAKGKLDSDKHIHNLESELAGLREELEQRISLEQFLDRLEQTPEPKKDEPTKTPQEGQSVTQEDITKTVKQILSTEKDVSTRQSNVDFVKQQLEKAWGKDYQAKLKEISDEAGGQGFLESVAETNPKAFLKLVGVGTQVQNQQVNTDDVTPPRSQVSSFIPSNSNKQNYASFEKMRKEDPKRYWSAANQLQMHKIAEDMGDSFFS
jgi:hypothetical protein